jgi:hypothetical protein
MGDTIRRLWPRSHKQQLHQIPLAQRFANNYWAPLATTSKHKKKEHEEVAVIVARHSTRETRTGYTRTRFKIETTYTTCPIF